MLNVTDILEQATIYNVIGTILGQEEPGEYHLLNFKQNVRLWWKG